MTAPRTSPRPPRSAAFPGLCLAAVLLAGDPAAATQLPTSPERFLDGARTYAERDAERCRAHPPALAPDGSVSDSPLLTRIGGAAAGTTGGRDRRLLTVTRLDDAKSSMSRPSPEGTLRWAVDAARGSDGAWIVFAEGLAGTIRLEAGLHLPSNTTVDGGCGGIELTAAPRITQISLTDARNVIISGLAFTKDDYDDKADKTGDAIGLTDAFDRVAILHNDFHRCGDGCVDIVRKTRLSGESRASVLFNRFRDHNKVMLIGTLTCYKDKQAEGCADPLARLADVMEPHVFVTVAGNVFENTSQRHPKVVSNAMVWLANNMLVLRPTLYSSGADSAVYGSATGTGGVLVAQDNIFVNPERPGRVGAGPISVVRAATGGGREADGVVAAEDNVTVGNVTVIENHPEMARAFRQAEGSRIALTPANAEAVAGCLMRIAGPRGRSQSWPGSCPRP